MPGVFLRLKSHGTATFLIKPLDHYSDLLRAEPTNFSVFTESEKVSLNHIVIVVYLSIFLYVLTPEGGRQTYRKCVVYPADIWCQNDVVSMSMRRDHVASTLIRCHFYDMCTLGYVYGMIIEAYIQRTVTCALVKLILFLFFSCTISGRGCYVIYTKGLHILALWASNTK